MRNVLSSARLLESMKRINILILVIVVASGWSAAQTILYSGTLSSGCMACPLPAAPGAIATNWLGYHVNKGASSVWPGLSTSKGNATAWNFMTAYRTLNSTGGGATGANTIWGLMDCGPANTNCNGQGSQYDFSTLGAHLTNAVAAGVTTLFWTVTETPDYIESGIPINNCNYNNVLQGACFAPRDLCAFQSTPCMKADGTNASFKAFITAGLAYIQANFPQITAIYIEPWNEYNYCNNPNNCAWAGTNQQLVRMAADAYAIAHALTGVYVLTPPTSNGSASSIVNFLKALAPAGFGPGSCSAAGCFGFQVIDGFSQHAYIDSGVSCTGSSVVCPNPDDVGTAIQNIQSAMTGDIGGIHYSFAPSTLFITEGSHNKGQLPPSGSDPTNTILAFDERYILKMLMGSAGSVPVQMFIQYGWDLDGSCGGSSAAIDVWQWYVSTVSCTTATSGQANTTEGAAIYQMVQWTVGTTITQPAQAIGGNVSTAAFTTAGGIKRLFAWGNSSKTGATNCMYYGDAAHCPTFNVPAAYQSGGGNTKVCTRAGGSVSTTVSATGYQLSNEPVLFTPTSDSKCN